MHLPVVIIYMLTADIHSLQAVWCYTLTPHSHLFSAIHHLHVYHNYVIFKYLSMISPSCVLVTNVVHVYEVQ